MTAVPHYPVLLWVLWPLFHYTLYLCEFYDSCTTIPYTCVSSGTDQVPHRDYPERSVCNTLLFCEFCDCCTTIPYNFCEFCNTSGTLQRLPSGSVTDPIPYRDYPYPTEPILARSFVLWSRGMSRSSERQFVSIFCAYPDSSQIVCVAGHDPKLG